MISKTVTFIILVVVLTYTPALYGQDSIPSNRWGIVTKETVDGKASPMEEKSQIENEKGTSDQATTATSTEPQSQDDSESNKVTDTSDQPDSRGMTKGDKSQRPNQATTEPSQDDRNNNAKEKTSTSAKNRVPNTKEIKWANEDQKLTCHNYLQQLRDQFLKTRHFSIQGVPCKTADHANSFLLLADKCENECPKGLIEANGYTRRIIRNIQFLEKLGNDRCDDPPSSTQTTSKPTPATPQTKK